MKIAKLIRSLPTLNRSQKCPACGAAFACEIGFSGCWCGKMKLSATTRTALKAKYNDCLCPPCLEKAESEYGEAAVDLATP